MPFKHILVPTDGSARSHRAIRTAVKLARVCGAQLTSLYVVPEALALSRQPAALRATAAAKALGVAERAASAAGVRHSSARAVSTAPWRSIVRAAQARNCDLIVMATHGKQGIDALRSQTLQAITNTRVPVLVCR